MELVGWWLIDLYVPLTKPSDQSPQEERLTDCWIDPEIPNSVVRRKTRLEISVEEQIMKSELITVSRSI